MAKQSTHSELLHLFEVARRDVPTGAEVEHLQLSVLGALRAGATAQNALPELEMHRAPHKARVIKVMVSMGVAGLLAAGAAGLRSHWQYAAPPVASSVTLNASVTTAAGPTLDEAPLNAPLPTASVKQSEPQPVPTDRATASSSDTSTPPAQRATLKPPVPEAELIEQARQQLQNNPARALALTKRHRHLYPNGVLAPEREVIAIEALARLGKSQAAEKRAEAFRAAQPNSIHDLHLRSTLGNAGARRAP